MYIKALKWDPSDGVATKEKVESMVPNSRCIEIKRYDGYRATDLSSISITIVKVECYE